MTKRRFAFAAALLSCCLSFHARGAELGLLIMRATTVSMTNDERGVAGTSATYSFKVMNVATKEYFVQTGYLPMVQEVPAGVYCLYSVSSYQNFEVPYCGEPYFRVVAGKANNAGLWRMGINYPRSEAKLPGSVEHLEAVLREVPPIDEPLLRKYGVRMQQ